MLQLERQKLILEYLKQNRKATTNELSEMLGVSTTTIRTDLNQMDKEKLLTKTHGGALYHDNSADNKELTGKAYFFHERALETNQRPDARHCSDHRCQTQSHCTGPDHHFLSSSGPLSLYSAISRPIIY